MIETTHGKDRYSKIFGNLYQSFVSSKYVIICRTIYHPLAGTFTTSYPHTLCMENHERLYNNNSNHFY